MKIAITRRLFEQQIDRLRDRFKIEMWDSDIPPNRDELSKLLEDCDGALTLLTDKIDAELLDIRPQLRVVSNLAVGYDNIDVSAATARNVAVCTTPDVLTDTTAEYTIALLFAATRKVVESDRSSRRGEWKTWYPMRFLGTDLQHMTLGIIGFGRIGQRVAEIATAIGMRTLFSDSRSVDADVEQVPLDELLRRADVVTIHTPLTDETHHMMNGERLSIMKDDAFLINTARGGVIDTHALVEALKGGRFSSVALDVTDPEPLPIEHELYAFENVIITPHIASATVVTRTEMARLAVDNIIAVLDGTSPPNCLNPEVLNGK